MRLEVAGADEERALDALADLGDQLGAHVGDRDVHVRERLDPRVGPLELELEAVCSGVRPRRLNGVRVVVQADHWREAELRGRDRENAGAAADVQQRSGLELANEVEAQPSGGMRAGSERAAGIDDDGIRASRLILPRRHDQDAAGADRPVEPLPALHPIGRDVGRGHLSERGRHPALAPGVGVRRQHELGAAL